MAVLGLVTAAVALGTLVMAVVMAAVALVTVAGAVVMVMVSQRTLLKFNVSEKCDFFLK
jgi:hypothetical protein